MERKDLPALERLKAALALLPGIGARSAERLAFAILKMDEEKAREISESILKAKESVHPCPRCGLMTEQEGDCAICEEEDRDKGSLCVISDPKDFYPIEGSGSFHGLYHVLGGSIALSKGVDPDDLKIDELVERVEKEGFREVILATEPTLDGETTAMYIANLLKGKGVEVTRLGYGLSLGSSLEYVDTLTMGRAFEGRRKL